MPQMYTVSTKNSKISEDDLSQYNLDNEQFSDIEDISSDVLSDSQLNLQQSSSLRKFIEDLFRTFSEFEIKNLFEYLMSKLHGNSLGNKRHLSAIKKGTTIYLTLTKKNIELLIEDELDTEKSLLGSDKIFELLRFEKEDSIVYSRYSKNQTSTIPQLLNEESKNYEIDSVDCTATYSSFNEDEDIRITIEGNVSDVYDHLIKSGQEQDPILDYKNRWEFGQIKFADELIQSSEDFYNLRNIATSGALTYHAKYIQEFGLQKSQEKLDRYIRKTSVRLIEDTTGIKNIEEDEYLVKRPSSMSSNVLYMVSGDYIDPEKSLYNLYTNILSEGSGDIINTRDSIVDTPLKIDGITFFNISGNIPQQIKNYLEDICDRIESSRSEIYTNMLVILFNNILAEHTKEKYISEFLENIPTLSKEGSVIDLESDICEFKRGDTIKASSGDELQNNLVSVVVNQIPKPIGVITFGINEETRTVQALEKKISDDRLKSIENELQRKLSGSVSATKSRIDGGFTYMFTFLNENTESTKDAMDWF